MNNATELWQLITLASEADVRGTATEDEKSLLAANPTVHLEVLKMQKLKVEYQFSSHKLSLSELYAKLLSKKLTLVEYTDQRKEQFLWKTKAISYLMRIEEKMSQLKLKTKA